MKNVKCPGRDAERGKTVLLTRAKHLETDVIQTMLCEDRDVRTDKEEEAITMYRADEETMYWADQEVTREHQHDLLRAAQKERLIRSKHLRPHRLQTFIHHLHHPH